MASNHQGMRALNVVQNRIAAEFPTYRIMYKDESFLMKLIDVLLRVITFGSMTSFLTKFTTTIGTTVYVTRAWANRSPWSKCVTLRHEAEHMRQRARYGRVAYALTYLFWPVPVLFATGRRDLEREAYEETLRACVEYYGINHIKDRRFRARIVSHFLSSSYFWMWPFRTSCERWYDGVVAEIESETEVSGVWEG